MKPSLRHALLGGWLISAMALGWWFHAGDSRHPSQPPSAHSHATRSSGTVQDLRSPENVEPARDVIQVNPRDPGYDPVRVGAVLDLSVRQLFTTEPRVATWADRVEAQERSQMEAIRNVFPSIQVEEVECRTATCRTTVSVTPAELDDLIQYVQRSEERRVGKECRL